MPSNERRAAARRRAWGRGPHILRFEPLEGRQLLSIASGTSTSTGAPELVAVAFDTLHDMDWGDSFQAIGTIRNQGTATTTVPFNVDVYASTSTSPDANGVYVGSATIPAGLAPGATVQFNQAMQSPPAPLPDLGSFSSYYLDLVVDASNAVGAPAGHTSLDQRTLPYSVVTVMPHAQASLVAGSFATDKGSASWGDTIQVSGKIVNNGQGIAPATRATVVLTPQGQAVGTGSDFTIGSINVPTLGAYQDASISGKFTLPANPPAILGGATNLNVTLVPDAGYQTRPALAPTVSQGLGIDSVPLAMNAGAAPLTPAQQPNLSVASIQLPTTTVTWGGPFQANARITNTGPADAGPFLVRFLLVDANRPNANPLAIADAQVSGLKAGASTDLSQAVNLAGMLPNGVIPANIAGHVVVQVDPENAIDEPGNSNRILASGPVAVRLVSDPPAGTTTGSTTTAPTPPATTSPAPTDGTTTPTAGAGAGSGSTPSTTPSGGGGTTTTVLTPHGARRHRLIVHQPHPAQTRQARMHKRATAAPRKHATSLPKTRTARPRLRIFGAGS